MDETIRARKIADYCVEQCSRFLSRDDVFTTPVRPLVLDEIGNPRRERNKLTPLKCLSAKGVYAFCNERGTICYVGQGGEGKNTCLFSRLGQELRPFQKTERGNNGATLSKNCHDIDGVEFSDFKKHIAGWSLLVLHSQAFEVSTLLLEAFLIDLVSPKLNRTGSGCNRVVHWGD